MRRLVLRLFGEPSMHFDGEPVRLPAPVRCVALLALLVLRGGKAWTRASLAAAIWPDDLDTDARAKLRRHLHLLQQALPKIEGVEWIDSTAGTVAWNSDAPAWIDVVAFEQQCAGDAVSRAQAIEVYRGDLMEASYDEFLFADRERLRALYVDACLEAAMSARRDRELREAIGYVERILAKDEWREDALRLAMGLRYESGDRSSALTLFERFAKRLADEMNVAPMPETLALRDAILTNAGLMELATGDADVPAESSASAAIAPFVGRAAEIERLEAAWRHAAAGRGTVLFVGGDAGI